MKQTVKTRQEIADSYGISRRTLMRWLSNAEITLDNRLVTPKEQQLIYEKLGNPNINSRDGEDKHK